MAQYLYYKDPNSDLKCRDGLRDGAYIIDREKIIDGFLQDEGVGWFNVVNTPLEE